MTCYCGAPPAPKISLCGDCKRAVDRCQREPAHLARSTRTLRSAVTMLGSAEVASELKLSLPEVWLRNIGRTRTSAAEASQCATREGKYLSQRGGPTKLRAEHYIHGSRP